MEMTKRPLRVLMFPWLAHGHISPYIELAKRLSSRNDFHFTLCSTRINLLSISRRRDLPVDLVELQLPQLPDLPANLQTTKCLPPHLMPTLKAAFDLAGPAFGDILDALRPDLLLHDPLQPWAPAAASRRGIPTVVFSIFGAANMFFIYQLMVKERRDADTAHPFPDSTVGERDTEHVVHTLRSEASGMSNGKRLLRCFESSSGFILVKSSREIEGHHLDYLNSCDALVRKEHIPVGPLVPDDPPEGNEDVRSKLMQWLDKKESSSVVFASFGSEYFMEEEELREIGKGLEQCGLDFIWSVRFPMGEEERSTVVDDLQVRFSERRVMLQGWAPQVEILAHRSTGAFLTHCGWSSVMEAIRYGVPMAAMPCQLDQPLNAKVMVDAGVALEVKREEDGRYSGEEVANVVREVVIGDGGKLLRSRAKEVWNKMEEKSDGYLDYVSQKLFHLASRHQ